MKKEQLDRQRDDKPVEPYAGGRDSRRPESGFKAPDPSEKDKGKAPRRPKETAGDPGAKERFDDERSDRTSGRPLQLENEETPQPGRADAEPGRGDPQREARQDRRPAGEPIQR